LIAVPVKHVTREEGIARCRKSRRRPQHRDED
jgi:hypothetical protein